MATEAEPGNCCGVLSFLAVFVAAFVSYNLYPFECAAGTFTQNSGGPRTAPTWGVDSGSSVTYVTATGQRIFPAMVVVRPKVD